MKLGILGTGMIVQDLLTTFDKLSFEAVYVLGTESTRELTEQLKEKYQLDRTYYDYDELLNSDIDTVYVALPNFLHYSFALKALENNKHVIIEKPITSNYKELKHLKEVAKKNNLIILEAMNIHYLPAYKSIKGNVDKLGDIKVLTLNYSQYSSRYNAFKEGNILPAFDYKKSGGALMDLNVYNIHFIVGLFGKPLDVQYYPNIEKNIDTSGILVLDYGQFKVTSIGAKDCKAPVMCTIQGDKGNIVIKTPVNQTRKYSLNSNDGESQEFSFDEETHRLYYEFVEFMNIIDNKDYDKANEMLEISSIASELMEEARKKGGIVFDSDK
jgi:predicted dehydrogenase